MHGSGLIVSRTKVGTGVRGMRSDERDDLVSAKISFKSISAVVGWSVVGLSS